MNDVMNELSKKLELTTEEHNAINRILQETEMNVDELTRLMMFVKDNRSAFYQLNNDKMEMEEFLVENLKFYVKFVISQHVE